MRPLPPPAPPGASAARVRLLPSLTPLSSVVREWVRVALMPTGPAVATSGPHCPHAHRTVYYFGQNSVMGQQNTILGRRYTLYRGLPLSCDVGCTRERFRGAPLQGFLAPKKRLPPRTLR